MKRVRHFAFPSLSLSPTMDWGELSSLTLASRHEEETGHLSCVKLHKRNERMERSRPTQVIADVTLRVESPRGKDAHFARNTRIQVTSST